MVISELTLNGILHLFALLSSCYDPSGRANAREVVGAYLSDYLGIVHIEQYLGLFDGFLDFYDEEPDLEFLMSRTTDICGNLAGHIPRPEQYAVLLRLFELARAFKTGPGDILPHLADAAGKAFEIEDATIRDMLALLYHAEEIEILGPNLLFVHSKEPFAGAACKCLVCDYFSGGVTILHINDIDTLFLAPHRGCKLTLNGIPVKPGTFSLLPTGAILRDAHSVPIYYADIAASFKPRDHMGEMAFVAQNVDFRFPGSDNGLHDFCFNAGGGQMVGVMGGSGVGKSTLISILNGSMEPQDGQILINGLDLYGDKQKLEGVIGFVPQDDLLFDELTVYENLFYSSRLCLADLEKDKLSEKVIGILDELNQLETRDLTVGSPLEKTISGGQRKRLNIALELIREPSILFVDEPTSGLSSADSLNVISLLKEQSNKGKLIIIIIHQPSSDIFKMFDQLWILDKGGRPIYTGNPIDAIVYFRKAIWQAGTEECLCPQCGNVNPEQIFDIIEMKELDNQGYSTARRRFSPTDWHDRHKETRSNGKFVPPLEMDPPAKALQRPGLAGQLAVFFKRNILARMANRQYLAINLLEAPFLAWVIASIAKFENAQGYVFGDNHNIPVYFFMSVIVALFMGLSVSAEEIIRDRKILSRERFLHLSWFSYINAKVLYLCIVGAVQMGLYVLVGNTMLEIPEFSIKLWLVLFSSSVCASMIGLNISAAFKTVVTIYIMIPLLLVPQIIIGGMVVSFDDLIPPNTGHNRVPVIGNLMPSRWGFEAAVVAQFSNNRFQAPYNELDGRINRADYMINYYVPELRSQIDFPFLDVSDPLHAQKVKAALGLLKNEFTVLAEKEGVDLKLPADAFEPQGYSRGVAKQLKAGLSELVKSYRRERKTADGKRSLLEAVRITKMGETGYQALEKKYQNKSLVNLVRNRDNLDDYRLTPNKIVRLSDPVFSKEMSPWGGAPFFVGQKQLGNVAVSTYLFNLMVLWMASCLLYMALYWNLLTHILGSAASVALSLYRNLFLNRQR
jgi:ABC-type multidrug transport system ATPase subunit